MEKVMTWAEIESEFDGEWVLIEDTVYTHLQEIAWGKVIFHSKERADVYKKMGELPRLDHDVLFVGDLAEGWEMVL